MRVTEQAVHPVRAGGSDLPVAHLAHPSEQHLERPTLALCGAEILGVPTDDLGLDFVTCEKCLNLAGSELIL